MYQPIPNESIRPNRKTPLNSTWKLMGVNEHHTSWQYGKNNIYALSSVIWLADEHQPVWHWEWLISFSIMGKRSLSNSQVDFVLEHFGAKGFEEDNHEPGIARKFWQAADEKFRIPCPCKDEEIVKIEGTDYEYSRKKK